NPPSPWTGFSGSGRTDSTIDDSPFGSSLNTPADEDMREPFAEIGERLKELEIHPKSALLIYRPTAEPNSKQVQSQAETRLSSFIFPVLQDQVEAEDSHSQDQSFGSCSSDNISQAAAEENFDLSLSNVSGTSAIADGLISSFPTVPFSSPEIPNDQVFYPPSVPFSRELSRSLQSIQSHSVESSSAAVVSPSPSIQGHISPEDSPIFYSPELEQGFNAHSRASSLYNLPNVAISPSMIVTESKSYSEMETLDVPSTQATLTVDYDYTDLEPEYTFSALRSLDLSPTNLPILSSNWSKIAFSPGIGVGDLRLDYISAPPKGTHRFAHWGECAVPHIMIFLAAFGTGMWFLALGMAGLGLGSAMVFAWQDFDFRMGEQSEGCRPLGEDDRESIWMVVRMYVLAEESKMWFTGNLDKGLFA
ncbi:hypothetical protein BT96DRAFT_925105, partial [Gymnopus androsaceus JB14]